MGSCQNYGPFLGTLNNRCRIILRTQKGTIILTTTHTWFRARGTLYYNHEKEPPPLGVPYLGVLIIRIVLFRVLY